MIGAATSATFAANAAVAKLLSMRSLTAIARRIGIGIAPVIVSSNAANDRARIGQY